LAATGHHGVIDVLRSPRVVDQAPAEVCATLFDEGDILCTIRTIYRIRF